MTGHLSAILASIAKIQYRPRTLHVVRWYVSGTTRMRLAWLVLAILMANSLAHAARAEDYKTIWVDPGQSVDVYWDINLSGKVFLAADINGHAACLDYWWIVWPFTQIKQLGRHCGRATIDLPTLSDWAVGGKLRAGGAEARTRLRGTASEAVAHRFPEISF
ncbi:MAG: hypothetical protein HY852_13955 [Bradyrhizobium sp.]|uniref:hypothetical protein n=1 Tax=Bradyrhizobium sp. TaxID=376 RepID=UPI0025BD4898|nr:hypothetical protein [Bradyrhizobium sp.]MBI5262913.1 hypothetical protein [Bradyrhizobium sp.]